MIDCTQSENYTKHWHPKKLNLLFQSFQSDFALTQITMNYTWPWQCNLDRINSLPRLQQKKSVWMKETPGCIWGTRAANCTQKGFFGCWGSIARHDSAWLNAESMERFVFGLVEHVIGGSKHSVCNVAKPCLRPEQTITSSYLWRISSEQIVTTSSASVICVFDLTWNSKNLHIILTKACCIRNDLPSFRASRQAGCPGCLNRSWLAAHLEKNSL